MTLMLRRPARATTKPAARKGYAKGGGVYIPPTRHVDDNPDPAHQVAARALINSGVDRPTAQQKSHVALAVARDRDMGGVGVPDATAVAQAAQMHSPGSSLPPSVQAALDLRHAYAAGGVARPPSSFAPMALPSVATPGLASPRGLIGAHHRQHFASGGVALPPNVLAALALRPHFEDGGEASGSDHSSSSSSSSSAGGSDGDGHGNSSDSSSSSSSSSGSAGGVGGFGGGSSNAYGGGSSGGYGGVGGIGGSNDGYGGSSSSSSSSSSSGYGGGVGGFGGTSGSDGYGGSSSSGSNSSSSGSAGGVGGFGGSSSGDGYGGNSNSSGSSSTSTQSSGGFSSGAASGADSGGDGGSVGGSSATSGPVGSISGSYGAPPAGGFSSEGSPATGGFGNFGATPTATSNPSGLTGVGSSASMLGGQTASQSMASEAANSAGAAGEDGTGSASGVSTAGAFGSFGPSVGSSFGPSAASPFGGLDNARSTFGAQPDGTTGSVPSSVAASNPQGLSGLSPMGQQLGLMGMGGIDSGIAAMSNMGTSGVLNGPGAYGLGTEDRPGFDNFGSKSQVTASSFGRDGFEGLGGNPVADATMGNMPDAQGYVGTPDGLSPTIAAALALNPAAPGYTTPSTNIPASVADTLAATSPETTSALTVPGLPAPGMPMPGLPDYGKPFTPDFGKWNSLVDGVDQTKHPGYVAYGPNGPIGAPSTTSDVASPSAAAPTSPYGAMPANPFGTTNPTSATPGLNADGDPVAVGGVSALTIHGNISPFSGATAGDLSPSGQAMSDGVPTTSYGPGLAVPNATAGTFAQRMGAALALGQDAGVPSFSSLATNPETSPVPTSLTGATTFAGTPLGNITDAEALQARQNIWNGVGTQQDQDTVRNYLAQQNTPSEPGLGLGTPSFAAAPATSTAAPAVPGLPAGNIFGALHQIEGGVLNGQPDPGNPTHYGPAQFSQDTFSDTARQHPELGIDPNASMFGATAQQYADATQAHWGDIGAAITGAGLPDTPGNRYLGWNLGITGGIRAISAGPDATLAQAGISPAVQRANPSIYGGVATVGQLQAKLDGMFSGTTNQAASPTSSVPAGLGLGPGAAGTFSPSGVSFSQPGEDSTPDAPAAPAPAPAAPVTRTVTTPTAYTGTSAETDAVSGIGYDATPARTLTIHAFGLQDPANPESPMNAAANIMGLPGDTPIDSMTSVADTDQLGVVTKQYAPVISDAAKAYAEKQYPGIMDGVQTVGQLRDKIATMAATAGPPTTSTVTEPGAPTAAPLTISPAARTTTPFSGYTGADGDSPAFGLNTISAGVPTTINNAGTYGVPTGVGLSQDAQNLAGYSQVPSSVPTLARGIIASPSFSPETGFSTPSTSTPDTSAPSTGGVTFNGPTAPADGTSDPTTPDGAPAKHLSVPSWAGNGVAGFLAGSVLGPVGSLLGFGNTVSGWFGGPTAADGINGILAHPGSPTSVTGSPTSASNSTTSNSDALPQQNMVARVAAPSGSGDGSAPADPGAAASTGINPLDPHATATAAYQAALAGMNGGSGTTAPATGNGRVIRGRPVPAPTPTPIYRPMEDPAVRRALGLE